MLGWSADDLARASRVSVNTIRRAETAGDELRATPANLLALRQALEAGGVIFIEANGDGAGVRLRKTPPALEA